MASPTQEAEFAFNKVSAVADGKMGASDSQQRIHQEMYFLASGLNHLATGLRATYMKLEEIERTQKEVLRIMQTRR